MLVILRSTPVAAPAPAAVGERAPGRVVVVQHAGVGAGAVDERPGVGGLVVAAPIDIGIQPGVDVDRLAVRVQ